jgi:hypothetical protein
VNYEARKAYICSFWYGGYPVPIKRNGSRIANDPGACCYIRLLGLFAATVTTAGFGCRLLRHFDLHIRRGREATGRVAAHLDAAQDALIAAPVDGATGDALWAAVGCHTARLVSARLTDQGGGLREPASQRDRRNGQNHGHGQTEEQLETHALSPDMLVC